MHLPTTSRMLDFLEIFTGEVENVADGCEPTAQQRLDPRRLMHKELTSPAGCHPSSSRHQKRPWTSSSKL